MDFTTLYVKKSWMLLNNYPTTRKEIHINTENSINFSYSHSLSKSDIHTIARLSTLSQTYGAVQW